MDDFCLMIINLLYVLKFNEQSRLFVFECLVEKKKTVVDEGNSENKMSFKLHNLCSKMNEEAIWKCSRKLKKNKIINAT